MIMAQEKWGNKHNIIWINGIRKQDNQNEWGTLERTSNIQTWYKVLNKIKITLQYPHERNSPLDF
jgi:hypothetical protein